MPEPDEKEQLPLTSQPWWKRLQLRSRDVINYLFLIALAIYVVYSVVINIYQNYQTKQEIAAAQAEIEQLKLEREKLKSLLAYYDTASYQEIELRRRLLLKKPGEAVVALRGAEPLSQPEQPSTSETETQPPPLQWYDFYFGQK